MLPILHLNGYKIANPTVLARIPQDELRQPVSSATATSRISSKATSPTTMHQHDGRPCSIGARRNRRDPERSARRRLDEPPGWPMIVLAHSEGLDRPEGQSTARRRRHVARASGPAGERCATNRNTSQLLEEWMKSYRPEELFDADGSCSRDRGAGAAGDRRMSANPHANGGLLLKDLELPDFRDYAVDVPRPGATIAEATRVMGACLRDVMRLNPEQLPPVRAGRDRVQPARRPC